MENYLIKKNSSHSLHFVGNHLNFSSLVFALKRVEYLNNFDGHDAFLIELSKSYQSNIDIIFRLVKVWKMRKKLSGYFEGDYNLLHVYSLIDLLILLIIRPFNNRVAICLSIYELKINKFLEILLRSLFRRVDHIFVSSRFVTDQVWSMFDLPPSRCTVLAITKYLERKDINLVKMKPKNSNSKEINIGCFIGSSNEIGAFVRFKNLLNTKYEKNDVTFNFKLMRNSLNSAFIPNESSYGKIKSIIVEDIDLIELDFWLVFSNTNPCPYINDALKIGARIITPSTHYTSELERTLGPKLITYKAREVSSAVRMLIDRIDDVISGTYVQEGLSGSSWAHERKYLIDGYNKAIRRRENLYRISAQSN